MEENHLKIDGFIKAHLMLMLMQRVVANTVLKYRLFAWNSVQARLCHRGLN